MVTGGMPTIEYGETRLLVVVALRRWCDSWSFRGESGERVELRFGTAKRGKSAVIFFPLPETSQRHSHYCTHTSKGSIDDRR